MIACGACGRRSEDGFRFCPGCGSPLDVPSAAPREERKVVTALFCDLVGYTNLSEQADPEDVQRMLDAYFRMARSQVEAHGGVVSKFIGDAVLGVFGVPAAHEDDPERAVRAALRIVEDAAGLRAPGGTPLGVRIGINTGEALVQLGVAPGSGEHYLTGDPVNTASRIQAMAPEMGVAVGLTTYGATRAVFDYEELAPATLKGKTEAVRVFWAKSPRARLGTDLTRTYDTPFVGRAIDLALLRGLFDKAMTTSSVQVVTIVGEPGIGKSRIVTELSHHADEYAGLVTWRQGRCLPYGDGISFWALGEILKAHAGILETDPPDVAGERLEAVLPDGGEREWFRQRLLPLLGIGSASTADREEQFTAWRRFLEHVAETRPTVLVFEDLHWADDALLAFIEHLGDRAEGVPLLVVCTARPELFARHPTFGSALPSAHRINLAVLTDAEAAELVAGLLESMELPAEVVRPILDRAGGNPFYTEELVRLLRDRDLLVQAGDGLTLREGATVPLPDSVQALIAARLDTLDPGDKALLADASVIGKVFWSGAVAAIGERDGQVVADGLRALARREFVRQARVSSMLGDTEHAFWHVLTRDVAYGQLSRAARAARHTAAADWLEAKAGDRVEDVSDVIAYHLATALDLARTAGEDELASSLEPRALRFLLVAGQRALGLDTDAARSHFLRALALAPTGSPVRAQVLARVGEAAFHAGQYVESAQALEEAVGLFRDTGDIAAAAEAMLTLCTVLPILGQPEQRALAAEALVLLQDAGPSRPLVMALAEAAGTEAIGGRPEDAIRFADQALEMADQLGMARPARALGFRGVARTVAGDADGLDDLRAAATLAADAGNGREFATTRLNLAGALFCYEGPAAAVVVVRETAAFAAARGLSERWTAAVSELAGMLIEVGEIEESLATIDRLDDGRQPVTSNLWDLMACRSAGLRARWLRGQADQEVASLGWVEANARRLGSTDYLAVGLGLVALVRTMLGEHAEAAALLDELAGASELRESGSYYLYLPALVRSAVQIGRTDLARRLVDGPTPGYPLAAHAVRAAGAAIAEAAGDLATAQAAYTDAAERWERFGVVPEHAFALLGVGRCAIGRARPLEAADPLDLARAIFARLGARPALDETDRLLGLLRG